MYFLKIWLFAHFTSSLNLYWDMPILEFQFMLFLEVFEKLTKDSWDAIHQKIFCSDFILVSFPGRIGRYLIGPFNAGPFLTPVLF